MEIKEKADKHDRYAPCWAIAMIILVITGLSTICFNAGSFWKGYVLDMAGPAWKKWKCNVYGAGLSVNRKYCLNL